VPGTAREASHYAASVVNLQHFLTTGTGTRLTIRLSRLLPRRLGHSLIRIITGFVARRDSQMTKTVRSNLSVVLDTMPTDEHLDPIVHEVLYQSASGTFDFFRALGASVEENRRLVDMSQGIWDVLDPGWREGRGLLVVAPHLGTQDLGGIGFAAGSRSHEVQVLSYALPPSGYELVNDLRATEGLILTPSGGDALRQAAERLRSGGIVFTSLDRPPPRGKRAQTTEFFGKPARLWDGFARLAASTDSILQIIWVERLPDRRYRLNLVRQLDPRTMDGADPAASLWKATLKEAETIIREHPDQWLMFFPVWPENAQ
jgi:lauroyl/myristoyl acyltransferase